MLLPPPPHFIGHTGQRSFSNVTSITTAVFRSWWLAHGLFWNLLRLARRLHCCLVILQVVFGEEGQLFPTWHCLMYCCGDFFFSLLSEPVMCFCFFGGGGLVCISFNGITICSLLKRISFIVQCSYKERNCWIPSTTSAEALSGGTKWADWAACRVSRHLLTRTSSPFFFFFVIVCFYARVIFFNLAFRCRLSNLGASGIFLRRSSADRY